MTQSQQPSTVNCSIRQPIIIKFDETKSEFKSGLVVIEVKFPNVLRPEVGEIHFKNYYAASVSLKMKERGGMVESVDNKWKTLVKKMQLMPYPHCENGSQDYFTIEKKQADLTCGGCYCSQMLREADNIFCLRFILYQPSPVWKEFRIENIKLYKSSFQDSSFVSLPSWLTNPADESTPESPHADNTGANEKKPVPSRAMVSAVIPNIDGVAQCLQQLWALAEKVKVKGNRNPLGRYDVDGVYEINLLSYT